ncbi:MAG: Hsp70 family protein [Akkermansiaceae bacterium]|jgi:molecular chaperone DnaK|nr:Hsp70 family protein [Akkermansiaceae bacterium]
MVVGIDLGTTFSLISYLNAKGIPALCPDRTNPSRFQTPSVVHIGPNGAVVGDLCEALVTEDPSVNICRFAKLGMGKPDPVYLGYQDLAYRPEAVSALILKKLMRDAEAHLDASISGAVITIPAHFNEAQRKATVDAGRLADLPVLGLVEEPVAAAAFFGIEATNQEETVFVFDLGGGTLDATILQSSPEGLYVLATEGSDNLGGKNFDEVIMAMVREQYETLHRADLRKDSESMQKLRSFATAAKIEVNSGDSESVNKTLILGGKPMKVTFNRRHFNLGCEGLLEACEEVCERVLNAVSLTWQDMDHVILTGGSSLLPCVEQKVREISKLPAARIQRKQPHAAVAYGAALLAEQLYGKGETIAPPLKQSVTTNELGLRVMDPVKKKPVFRTLIEKHVPVPVSVKQTLYTHRHDQKSITLELMQRKNDFEPPETLGQFTFGPLANAEINYPIEVEIGFSAMGRTTVIAKDSRTSARIEREISAEETEDWSEVYQHLSSLPLKA